MNSDSVTKPEPQPVADAEHEPVASTLGQPVAEYHGPKGLEPTRYGDWERKGRCIDF